MGLVHSLSYGLFDKYYARCHSFAVGTVLIAGFGMRARYFLPRKMLAPPLSTSLGATHRTAVLVVSRL